MGLFRVEIEVLPANGGSPERVSVRVDAGASYPALPASLWSVSGAQPPRI